jgi:flagellar biosynthesis protein FlhG
MHSITEKIDQATRLRQIVRGDSDRIRTASIPHVLTVTSGKGGVGKSTVALNMAIKMCDFGKRVMLFDADANLANIDVLLGISPENRLGNVLRGEIGLEDALLSPHQGLFILAGSSGDAYYPKMDGVRQKYIIAQLCAVRKPVDYIIIDTAAGVSEEVVNYSVYADETIVVTNPEPTSVMDAYAVIKMISIAKPEHEIGLVVNSASTTAEADDTAEKLIKAVTHFLKRSVEYAGSVPYDPNVGKSVVLQQALVQQFPRSRASLSIQQIAHKLLFENNRIYERRFSTI